MSVDVETCPFATRLSFATFTSWSPRTTPTTQRGCAGFSGARVADGSRRAEDERLEHVFGFTFMNLPTSSMPGGSACERFPSAPVGSPENVHGAMPISAFSTLAA
jgi:hypothetical protein